MPCNNNFYCSITKSMGQLNINIYQAAANSGVRAWPQVVDRQDGSYIIRYELIWQVLVFINRVASVKSELVKRKLVTSIERPQLAVADLWVG